jgi:hypothetical protein
LDAIKNDTRQDLHDGNKENGSVRIKLKKTAGPGQQKNQRSDFTDHFYNRRMAFGSFQNLHQSDEKEILILVIGLMDQKLPFNQNDI